MAVWRQNDDWVYELFPLTTPASDLGQFAPFIEMWQSKRAGDRLPAWADFVIDDFAGWWGWVSVFDIVGRNPFTIKVRLAGTGITALLAHETTGRVYTASEIGKPPTLAHIQHDDLDYFEALTEQPQLGRTIGKIDHALVGWCDFFEIALPLADNGETIDKIILPSAYRQISG